MADEQAGGALDAVGATLRLLQFENHLLRTAMGGNPDDRFGENGTVATVAVARRAYPTPLKSLLGVAARPFIGANLKRR